MKRSILIKKQLKKPILLCCVALAMCLSCEKHNITDDFRPQNGSISTKAAMDDYNVSFKEANILANKLDSGSKAYSINAYTKDEDTLFYVVNYRSGWKIISGDKRTQAILAEDNSGSLDLRTIDNPGVKIWFEDLSDRLRAIKNIMVSDYNEKNLLFWRNILSNYDKEPVQTRFLDPTDTSEIGSGYRWVRIYQGTVSSDTYIDVIPHLLDTKWGQRNPWNIGYPYNPNNPAQVVPTGCTAVAMAQVIYHSHYRLGKPSWLKHGSTVSGTVPNNYYYVPGQVVSNSPRWDDMPLNATGSNTNYVGSLMADVGYVTNMQYGLGGSGAWPSISAFNYFDINCLESTTFNTSTVNTSLQSGSPVIIVAFADSVNGHTWVIDGKTTRQRNITDTYEWVLISHLPNFPSFNEPGWTYYTQAEAMAHDPDLYSGKIENVLTTVCYDFWRMNWGYDGQYDTGYYDPLSGWTANGYTFKYNKHIWYNFVAL